MAVSYTHLCSRAFAPIWGQGRGGYGRAPQSSTRKKRKTKDSRCLMLINRRQSLLRAWSLETFACFPSLHLYLLFYRRVLVRISQASCLTNCGGGIFSRTIQGHFRARSNLPEAHPGPRALGLYLVQPKVERKKGVNLSPSGSVQIDTYGRYKKPACSHQRDR